MLYMLWEKETCKWHHDLSSHSFYFLHFIFKVHTLYSSLANTTEWFFIFLKRKAFINALFNQLMFCQVKKCLTWQDDILSGGVLTLLDPGPEPGPDSLLAGPWPYQGGGAWSPALGSGHTRPKMWPVCVGGGLKVVRPMINLKCGRKIVSFRNAPPRLSHKMLHIPQKGFLKSRGMRSWVLNAMHLTIHFERAAINDIFAVNLDQGMDDQISFIQGNPGKPRS